MKHSPLDAAHRALGAKMVPFGGWEMPLSYPGGTLAEHRACREAAVAFDVSHLGTVELRGAGAFDRLQTALTNDLRKISPGQAQYTHLLDEADGAVVDDIIVWWLHADTFLVMPNASNTASVLDALGEGAVDTTDRRAVIAVQGPTARATLAEVHPDIASVPRFAVRQVDWQGVPIVVAGTGYTGEDGVECAVPTDDAHRFWEAVIAAGIAPAGLGARDLLRLEAGLPLHGHELGAGITPLQAGLAWVVGWDKPEFRGKAALERERAAGITRRLRGLVVDGRQPPRDGYRVLVDGEEVGTVTSGNFSPVLGKGIALGFLPPDIKPGATVDIDIRGRATPAAVVKLPFLTKDR